jgi:hypothetical protein
MIDRTKIMPPPVHLRPELLTDSDNFFAGGLLDGGQVIPTKKRRTESHHQNYLIICGPAEAIRLRASCNRDGELHMTEIEFNLSKLLFGHNGYCLNEDLFLRAMTVLLQYIEELVAKPEEALRVIPGLVPGSEARFQLMEIFFQITDPDSSLFETFLNVSHPCSSKRLTSVDESIRIGKKTSKTSISIYRKTKQMVGHYGDDLVSNDTEILRIELILKADHLAKAFTTEGATTTPCIDVGMSKRLAGFRFDNLAIIHRTEMLRLQGISPRPATNTKYDKTGCFLAVAHHQMASPGCMGLLELIDLYESQTNSKKDKVGRVRRAALWQREQINGAALTLSEFFSEEAYKAMPSVRIPDKEKFLSSLRLESVIHPRIQGVYGSGSPSQPFTPKTTL